MEILIDTFCGAYAVKLCFRYNQNLMIQLKIASKQTFSMLTLTCVANNHTIPNEWLLNATTSFVLSNASSLFFKLSRSLRRSA